MTGKDLRRRVDIFYESLLDIENFLKEKGVVIEEGFIEMIRKDLGRLFFLIPLEKDDDDEE